MRSMSMLVLMLVMGSIPAWAALGDNVASVDSDAQALHAKHVMMARVGYNLHQITTEDGSVVNEFVSLAGTVFGVSWQGHAMPNLPQLLGTYTAELQQGQRTNVVRRRAVMIQTDNLVFSSVGRLRSFRGRAFVPGLVPANLSSEVVQ